MSEPDAPTTERREQPTERRKYTRRTVPSVSPPYFEVFERIAVALETISAQLENRQVRMPDVRVRPRSSSDRS